MNNLAWLLLSLIANPAPAADLASTAEKTQWKQTGRYEEAVRLCDALAKQHSRVAECIRFGKTLELRPMVALVMGKRQAGRPVVFAQGGIHAGEIDGKDAGFALARDMLEGKVLSGFFNKATWVFVPIFNIDGHERSGKYNRPNQVGPEEMGWRTTAQNLNLNRDYVKADAPEMRAMLKLMREWDPILNIDLHVTDGSDFEHTVSVTLQPMHKGPAALLAEGSALSGRLMSRLTELGELPLPFYPSLRKEDQPESGFEIGIAPPRFSDGYWGLRHRIGVLVETHSWKPYDRRVLSTRNSLIALFEELLKNGAAWRAAAKAADEAKPSELPLAWAAGEHSRTIDFKGYAYTIKKSDVSGAPWITYDATKPQIWKIPLFDELVAEATAKPPARGYYVPAGYASAARERLEAHGLTYSTLKSAQKVSGSVVRANSVKLADSSYEGHQTIKEIKGDWAPEARMLPAGSLFVPIAQTHWELVMHLFEPQAPDSLLRWGFFNSAFEPKEYMEAYVTEQVAREMLKDPAVKKEFEAKLKSDQEFKASAEARLDFFYRKHPSHDERLNLYPVVKE